MGNLERHAYSIKCSTDKGSQKVRSFRFAQVTLRDCPSDDLLGYRLWPTLCHLRIHTSIHRLGHKAPAYHLGLILKHIRH